MRRPCRGYLSISPYHLNETSACAFGSHSRQASLLYAIQQLSMHKGDFTRAAGRNRRYCTAYLIFLYVRGAMSADEQNLSVAKPAVPLSKYQVRRALAVVV